MDIHRIAFAANLNRAANTLDQLATRLAEGLTKLESLDESAAYIAAGAAIWGATLRGFLTVPEIVAHVEALKLEGFPEPDTVTDNGMRSSNVFFDAMSSYVYPLDEAVTPYESLGNSEQWPPTDDDRTLFRRNELRNQATGCRIFSRLIETAADKPDLPPAAHAIPQWNTQRRELSFRGEIVKTYRQPAKNQEAILDAFQLESWPERIDDPLLYAKDGDARQRLADAVFALNKNGTIVFELDGKQRIIWRVEPL